MATTSQFLFVLSCFFRFCDHARFFASYALEGLSAAQCMCLCFQAEYIQVHEFIIGKKVLACTPPPFLFTLCGSPPCSARQLGAALHRW